MAGDEPTCYVCLDSQGPLVRKTCSCAMWVHKGCLQQEIDSTRTSVCSTCRKEYRTKIEMKWDFTMCLWLVMLCVLLLDEALIVASTRMPMRAGLWFVAVDIAYGAYLCRYVQDHHRIVLVQGT